MISELKNPGTPEQAKVRTKLLSIYIGVDLVDYDLVEKAFAPRFLLDYTSIWGGEPALTTARELTNSWRTFLPGFDAALHVIDDLQIDVKGESAEATAEGDARLWLGEKMWRCVGRYFWELEQSAGEWKVTAMRFDMSQEIGDRKLLTVDAKNVVDGRAA